MSLYQLEYNKNESAISIQKRIDLLSIFIEIVAMANGRTSSRFEIETR